MQLNGELKFLKRTSIEEDGPFGKKGTVLWLCNEHVSLVTEWYKNATHVKQWKAFVEDAQPALGRGYDDLLKLLQENEVRIRFLLDEKQWHNK
jgi:hypothetical protein